MNPQERYSSYRNGGKDTLVVQLKGISTDDKEVNHSDIAIQSPPGNEPRCSQCKVEELRHSSGHFTLKWWPKDLVDDGFAKASLCSTW